jgi:hypothetical protein
MIMATSRLAFAIVTAGALLWIYGLTVVIMGCAKPILPKKGRELLWVFLACFLGSLYLLFLYFSSSFLAMETTFLIALTPLSCIGSGICRRTAALENKDAIRKALSEALVLGSILLALALIREPLGFGSLSFPGGLQGMVILGSSGPYFPVQIIANASGGLLLLGYGLTLFRRFRNRYARREDPQ